MSYLRVSNPSALVAVNLYDIGYIVPISATNLVLSNQFSVQDLLRSADLEAAIIAGDLTVDLDYGTGFTAVAAVDYTNRDALATFANIYEITNENNNEDLVDGSEVNASGPAGAPLHIHDARYFTETEVSGTGGAALVGVDNSGWTYITGSTVQAALDSIDSLFTTAVTLDTAYDNDSDGILDVDGVTKPLNFRSNGTNAVATSRKVGADAQDFWRANPATDQLVMGAVVAGALAQIDVHILTNLIVDGNITFTGTITDQTVNELNVTDADIRLRTGAATAATAHVYVERGSTGADASLKWDEAVTRWKAGLDGSEETIALLEHDEIVSGTWLFSPTPTTDPNFLLKERASAPTTALGAATEIPIAMMANGHLALYDKSNSRNKFLSVARWIPEFTGRNSPNVKNEYAYIGQVNTFDVGIRVPANMTIVGITAQSGASATWTARVRINGSPTNIASLAVTAALGATDEATNVNVAAGDLLQVYIDASAGIDSPVVRLELARRY